jgi:uncharacterized protein
MGKVLVWVGIALAAWVVWRFVLVGRRRVREDAGRDAADAAGSAGAADRAPRGDERIAAPESMMQCAVCGVHLPASEARFARGRVYCSDAHRDRGAESAQDDPVRRDGA